MKIRTLTATAALGLAALGCGISPDEAPRPAADLTTTTTTTTAPASDPVTYDPAPAMDEMAYLLTLLDYPDFVLAIEEACARLRADSIVIDTPGEVLMAVDAFQGGAGSGTFTDEEAAYLIGAGLGRYCPDRIDL